MSESFLQQTVKAFDKIAADYDLTENQNEILKWMRGIVHKIYLQNFKSEDNLLELNCGTGEDAIFLAGSGRKVFATDISEKMIEILNAKCRMQKAEGSIISKVASFDEINTIEQNNFDGVISNFGGLNCINEFDKLSKDLSVKLKSKGLFIAVVMSTVCPWEIFYYMVKLDFKNAFRRFKKEGIQAKLNSCCRELATGMGEKVLTFYFSPKVFAKQFSQWFSVEKIYSLGYFTPPPFMIGLYRRFKPIVKLFMKLDEALMKYFPFNRFGDHFIIVMKKK